MSRYSTTCATSCEFRPDAQNIVEHSHPSSANSSAGFGSKHPYKQHIAAKHFTITNSITSDQLDVYATVHINTCDDENVCADIFTAASAVGGAVWGIAGGIFTSLGLTCNA